MRQTKQITKAWSLLTITIALAGVWGCGEDTAFRGEGEIGTEDLEPEPAPTIEVPPPRNAPNRPDDQFLLWQWECQSGGVVPVSASSTEFLKGGGTHQVDLGSDQIIDLEIGGRLCEPAAVDRDIVFVIDVSGSMTGIGGNDNSTSRLAGCGRSTAVRTVLSNLPDTGSAQVGLVTFDGRVQYSSPFLLNPSVLASQATNDILCDGVGNTDYTEALEGARTLLTGGRAGTQREIYFISDGDPTEGNGVAVADELKDPDGLAVTIATIMLGDDDDTFLRENIASDPSMHAQTNRARMLEKLLSDLATNKIEQGVLALRSLGESSWEKHDLMDYVTAGQFRFEIEGINRDEYPAGLEFKYSYLDSRGNEFSDEGKIVWPELEKNGEQDESDTAEDDADFDPSFESDSEEDDSDDD